MKSVRDLAGYRARHGLAPLCSYIFIIIISFQGFPRPKTALKLSNLKEDRNNHVLAEYSLPAY